MSANNLMCSHYHSAIALSRIISIKLFSKYKQALLANKTSPWLHRKWSASRDTSPLHTDGAHEMCHHPTLPLPPAQARTQCYTARRLYVSRPADFRSSPRPQIRGSAQGWALPPLRQGWRIRQELERLVCSAS